MTTHSGPDHDSVPLTAVVVTHQSAAVLAPCLRALRTEAGTVGGIELLVVDNASTDAFESVVRHEWPEATVLSMGRNAGYAAAINAAIEKRRGTGAVLVLNPDVRLVPGSLPRLVNALDRPQVGITVPRLVDESGRLARSLRREPTVLRAFGQAVLGRRADRYAALSEVVSDPAEYARDTRTDWATGAVMLVSAECLRTVGSWDESFFLYSEETDFCLRARDVGFAVQYVHEAVAQHLGGASNTDPMLWTVLTLNRVRLARRRLGRVRGTAFRAAVVANEAVRAAAGRPTSRAALAALLLPNRKPDRLRETRSHASLPSSGERRQASEARPIICFSAQDFWYHNRAHSDIQLMRRVARDRDVLFVNSIGMRMPQPGRSTQPWRRITRKAGSTAHALRTPDPDLPRFHVLSPLLMPLYSSPRARALNARLVALQVRGACQLLGFKKPVCVVTIPTAVEVLPHLSIASLVYNRSDKHSEFEEADQDYIRTLEQQLLRQSDRVLYVSHELMADEAAATGDRAVFLDHGVDLDLFSTGPHVEPADSRNLPRPRIGFFGGIDDYVVDLDLLERVARGLPEAHLLLIGDATCSIEHLTRLPNVTWLGQRPYEEIPAYGASFDVALMPWLDNQWIRFCNPIKLKEYLALGLPVVSTDFPEVRRHESVVCVARDPDDFVDLVRKTLNEGGPGDRVGRRAAVAHKSWDAAAKTLIDVCESIQHSRSLTSPGEKSDPPRLEQERLRAVARARPAREHQHGRQLSTTEVHPHHQPV